MKNNKKKVLETLPTELIQVEHEKGSVGEFIELLKSFPADGKINLHGSINIEKIDEDGEVSGVNIYPQCPDYCECNSESDDEHELTPEEEEANFNSAVHASNVLNKFTYGFDNAEPNMISTIRNGSTDKLIGAPIMVPHLDALDYEESYLLPNQVAMIDEIRHHNVYMAECMAELCRRGISAMLEYNTQVLAHFARESTKDMCIIVNNGTADKVLECIKDDEEL